MVDWRLKTALQMNNGRMCLYVHVFQVQGFKQESEKYNKTSDANSILSKGKS